MTPLAMEFMAQHRLWGLLIIPLIAVLYIVLAGRSTPRRDKYSRLQCACPAW